MNSVILFLFTGILYGNLYGSSVNSVSKNLHTLELKRTKLIQLATGYQSSLSFETQYLGAKVFYIDRSEAAPEITDISKVLVQSCELRLQFDDGTILLPKINRPGLYGFQGVKINSKGALFFLKPVQLSYYWSLYNWRRVCRSIDQVETRIFQDLNTHFEQIIEADRHQMKFAAVKNQKKEDMVLTGEVILRLLTMNPQLINPENFSVVISFLVQAQLNPSLDKPLTQLFEKILKSISDYADIFSNSQNEILSGIQNPRFEKSFEEKVVGFLKSENDFMLYLQMIRTFCDQEFLDAKKLTEESQARCFHLLTNMIKGDSAKSKAFIEEISAPDHNRWYESKIRRSNIFSPDGHRYRIMGHFLREFMKKLTVSIGTLKQPYFDR